MLKHLRIHNIVLIENAEIAFTQGLNVISGETGSGKSAIMNALGLIAGDRADFDMVRHGAEKGIVEVAFDVDALPGLHAVLEKSGIDHHPGDELIVRREISASNKSRAFINNQLAQVALLREIGDHLVDIVGQHANQRLLSVDKHRDMLDAFGEHNALTASIADSWIREVDLKKRLEELIQSEAKRSRDIEVCQMELTELQEANIQENEEEDLFSEYTLLANTEELTTKVSEVSNALIGDRGALPHLVRQKHVLEQLVRIDPAFTETAKAFEGALLEMQEVSHMLVKYQSRIENNPARLAEVNERLSLITRLKRKYGPTVDDIRSYQKAAEDRLKRLENADEEIEKLQNELDAQKQQNDLLCQQLTQKRKTAAQKIEKAVAKELRALNMPKASFQCAVTQQQRNHSGDDRVEFYLSPNVGEKQMPIKECASGGELSRVMLALQTILAGKEKTPTLVFDEIDANIGGETAAVVGEQLRTIGNKHQVLCITHFPQVAAQAQHHLQISKKEKDGRTVTIVKALDDTARQKELARMRGGV